MSLQNVQFSDSTEKTVIAWFLSPQDALLYPNMGTLDTSDERWATYYNGQPGWMQAMLPPPGAT